MFSIALVIFREVLEISLLLGVLLAATRGVRNRAQWVWFGLAAGIAGSIATAFFAKSIANAFEGMGQEVLNASILLVAAVLIGWTAVWMSGHARQMTQEFKALGQAVIQGKKPLYTLAIVVALSVLREGAEIVMFTYSALVTGEPVANLLVGVLCGSLSGAALGLIIYFGLMKIPTRQIFAVTTWMLVVLSAGMVSHAFGYLTASGHAPELIPVVWDSSWLLSDESILGRILGVLAGYTSRPSGIQVIMYATTFIVLGVLLKKYQHHQIKTV
jgi:high-affinity iron transporter